MTLLNVALIKAFPVTSTWIFFFFFADPLVGAAGVVCFRMVKAPLKLFLGCDFLLSGDGLPLSFACTGVRPSPLSPHRQPLAVAEPAVAVNIHEALDVHLRLATERALDLDI